LTSNGELSFLQLFSVTISVFQIKQMALICDLNRREAVVPNCTREKRRFHHVRCLQMLPMLTGQIVVNRQPFPVLHHRLDRFGVVPKRVLEFLSPP
jgi:hypothetical protein